MVAQPNEFRTGRFKQARETHLLGCGTCLLAGFSGSCRLGEKRHDSTVAATQAMRAGHNSDSPMIDVFLFKIRSRMISVTDDSQLHGVVSRVENWAEGNF